MRYILDDLGYIEEISFGGYIECNNKTCTEYTGAIPEGYDSLIDWVEKANIRAYKLVDGNLVFDETRAAELEKEYRIYKDPKIVYDITLTENTDIIEAKGLDMEADGGEYEFELIHAETEEGDLSITFNDITTGYYQHGVYYSAGLTANGTLNQTTFYRKGMDRIYYGTGGTTSIYFPAVMKGRFLFSNSTRKTVFYEFKNLTCIQGMQVITDLYGNNDQVVNNLTSIKFAKYNNVGKFIAGTRLIIRRK